MLPVSAGIGINESLGTVTEDDEMSLCVIGSHPLANSLGRLQECQYMFVSSREFVSLLHLIGLFGGLFAGLVRYLEQGL